MRAPDAEEGTSPLPAFFAWVAQQQAAGRLVFEVKGEVEGAWLDAAAAAPAPQAASAVAAEEDEDCGTQPATLALR